MGSLLDLQTEGGVLHGHFGWLVTLLDWIGAGIDIAAITLLVAGAARFVIEVVVAEVARTGDARVREINTARISLGRYILAGLELFIVSDIMRAALSLAFSDLLFLALLVIIRSITSYFLDREMAELRQELAK